MFYINKNNDLLFLFELIPLNVAKIWKILPYNNLEMLFFFKSTYFNKLGKYFHQVQTPKKIV